MESLNNYIDACRRSKFFGNHFKHSEQDKVKYFIQESNLERISDYPIQITFLFFEKSRKRDLDNISGWAHKAIIDALVKEGILDNDTWNYVAGHSDYFFIDKENPRIEVILESVNEAEIKNLKK